MQDGGFAFVEPYMAGDDFVKYNDNNGHVLDQDPVMQAFSHFSWQHSRGTLLVCDLQVRTCLPNVPIFWLHGVNATAPHPRAPVRGLQRTCACAKCQGGRHGIRGGGQGSEGARGAHSRKWTEHGLVRTSRDGGIY